MKTKETLTTNQDTTCKKCGSNVKPSKAFNDTLIEHLDLGSKKGDRGNTLSRNGKAKLVDCLKCTNCGHSWIPKENPNNLDKDITERGKKGTRILLNLQDEELDDNEHLTSYIARNRMNETKSKGSKIGIISKGIVNNKTLKSLKNTDKIRVENKDIKVFSKMQYTEFNKDLFLKYINKFSESDQAKMFRILENKYLDFLSKL